MDTTHYSLFAATSALSRILLRCPPVWPSE